MERKGRERKERERKRERIKIGEKLRAKVVEKKVLKREKERGSKIE